MSTINHGGDAFPRPQEWCTEGMTLRAYIAAKAMQGAMINGGCHGHIEGMEDPEYFAKLAVKFADALIAELEKEAK